MYLFASNLLYGDRKPIYISKFQKKHGGDGKRGPLAPFPFLAPWPYRPPAIETPLRPVPAGPLISWPKNASFSESHPERAAPLSHRDDKRRHAIGSHSTFALHLSHDLASCNLFSSCCFVDTSIKFALKEMYCTTTAAFALLRSSSALSVMRQRKGCGVVGVVCRPWG